MASGRQSPRHPSDSMDFRLNRFCGAWGTPDPACAGVVRRMGRRLDPAPAQGNVWEGDGVCLLARDGGEPVRTDGIVYAADGDREFREWLGRRGAPLLPRSFGAENTPRLRGRLKDMAGGWVMAARDGDGSLLLARDRVGLREMYYATHGGRLWFASNIRCFGEIPGWRFRVNRGGLSEYMAFRMLAGPETLFSGVFKVLPGEALVFRKGGVEPDRLRFWSYEWTPPPAPLPVARRADEFRALLRAQVTAALDGGDRLFLMLSGGIDSGALLALAEEARPGAVTALTMYPDEPGFSEAEAARAVCAAAGCGRHELVPVTAEDLCRLLFAAHAVMEQPVAHVAAILHMRMHESARGRFDGFLTGEAADTLIGNDRFARYHLCWRFNRPWTRAAVAAAQRITRLRKLRVWLDVTGADWKARACLARLYFGLPVLARVLRGFAPDFACRMSILDRPAATEVEAMARYYFETFVQSCKSFDAFGGHYGLEPHFTYMAQPVRDFAMTLSAAERFGRGRGKYILRRAMQGCLPERIVWGPKRAGEQPLGKWMRECAGLRDAACAGADEEARTGGFFFRDEVRRLVREHFAGIADHGAMLWQIMSLEIWHRMFIDGQAEDECRAEMTAAGQRARKAVNGQMA